MSALSRKLTNILILLRIYYININNIKIYADFLHFSHKIMEKITNKPIKREKM